MPLPPSLELTLAGLLSVQMCAATTWQFWSKSLLLNSWIIKNWVKMDHGLKCEVQGCACFNCRLYIKQRRRVSGAGNRAIWKICLYHAYVQIWMYASQHSNDPCTPMFTEALLTMAKLQSQPKCLSTGEWIKKMKYMYTTEYYVTNRKNKILPFVEK